MSSLRVNPDNKHVLSATEIDVYLLGTNGEFIVLVSRETYQAAITAWLDSKARYYKRTGEFAGVGYIRFFDLWHSSSGPLPLDRKLVEVFSATQFEIEMERG